MSNAKALVLIVEDEPEIAELIEFHAERAGMRARKVHSGRIALDVIKREKPDLIVLDLMLPDIDGLEVCRRLKQSDDTRMIPIVMVTAKGEEADIVAGIELGADDYVTKPFSPRVLMARLRNVLRRNGVADEPSPTSDRMVLLESKLVIDIDRHEILCDAKKVDLTLTEFGILHYLAGRPGFVRTRDQIISAVHGKSTVLSSRTVDVHITALRRKLGTLADCVETVRGVGYRFCEGANEED
ncbi:MAG: response regulator transcription factor [Planctomycetota bacterium]|jgi:two-component system, OmpR family, alkaline phosphatase synthesis response regulator PhoP